MINHHWEDGEQMLGQFLMAVGGTISFKAPSCMGFLSVPRASGQIWSLQLALGAWWLWGAKSSGRTVLVAWLSFNEGANSTRIGFSFSFYESSQM